MKSPFELYRKANPQYFSDSVVTYKSELTKEVFRNEMDKLSKDMKQDLFENFVTSLAHRFITPNIVPQTGPTGGGDGKTDLETHPVADKIAEKWYIADGGCKGSEKWAFAISCMERWKVKVKADVDKIANLGQGFTKIYFCSNRQIRSLDRKVISADLKKKYGLDVIILDQEWFVSRVFEDKCINIAIKELGLTQQYAETKEIGPNDLQRQRRLAEIEEIIQNNTSEDCFDTEYVDLVLESAFLSRALEESPSLIRGKFICAENICEKYGTKQQLYYAIWQRGWTEFYWLENPDKTYQCYSKLKNMLNEEVNVDRLENILSLYNTLKSASSLSLFKTDDIDFKAEDAYFENLCRVLEHDRFHQSSFLFLKIHHLQKAIMQKIKDKDALDELLMILSDTLEKAAFYIDMSFETLFDELRLISIAIPENEKIDEIMDHLSELMLNRQREIEDANFKKERGMQYLRGGYYVKAIRYLGQCVPLLRKEHTIKEYVNVCGNLGVAYWEMDLLYASKVMFTKAAAMLLYNIQNKQSPHRMLVDIMSKLCLLSLRSGQVVNFLMAFESWTIFEKYSPSYQDDYFSEEMGRDGRRLAARLLSCNVNSESYSKLPAILLRFGLIVPADILFYKLGYPECYSSDFKRHMVESPYWEEKMRQFIYNPLFLYANAISDRKTRLETLVCGCRFIATFDSDRILQVYSELLLAFLESFICITNNDQFDVTTPQIHFEVVKTNQGKTEICKGSSSNEYVFRINHYSINGREAWDAFLSFLPLFFTENVSSNNMGKIFADKYARQKVLSSLYVMMTYEEDVYAIYGKDYKNTIDMWTKPGDVEYPNKGKEEISDPFENNRGVQAKIRNDDDNIYNKV